MSSSDSESDYDRLDRKRKQKNEYRDRKDYSKDRKKRSRDRKRKHRSRSTSRSRSRSRSRSPIRDYSRSRSRSKSRKNKNKNKKRSHSRKRKYEDEIEKLKNKEIQKRNEMEILRKKEEEKKKIEEENRKKEKTKTVEKELTEEEKLERKRQARRARVKALALLESIEEKKQEALNIGNVLEDFLEKDKEEENHFNRKDKMLVDVLEKSDILEENIKNENAEQMKTDNQIITNFGETEEPHQIAFTFNKLHAKMPKLPKEFTREKEKETKIEKKSLAFLTQKSQVLEEEEDPIDAYMKSIEPQATIQDYELNQLLSIHQLQRRYDEIIKKDEIEDNVRMIEENTEKDHESENININKEATKGITLEDILDMKNKKTEKVEEEDIVIEDDEEFHKKFVEALSKTKAPEFDPIFGYINTGEEKKESVIYQEDVNEFMNEEAFMDIEEAWQRAKKGGEKGKELKQVNHSEINYEPFRKNLYLEAKEVSNMSEEQVNKFRKEHGDIKIRGKNIPRPIFNWYHCGLSEKIISVLERKGFKEPFPIQAQAIPCIMSGRDVIGIAETGSGKTLAYVLPMLRHVMDQRPLREGEGPIAILMAPTRELATQIYAVVKSFTKVLNLRATCVYGGAGLGSQVSELRRGAEIVVCTPGRMIEVLCLSNGKITNLQRVTYVVIDEADRMFDMGFEPQLSRILGNIRPDRQTVMFSATFPKQIENLAKKILIKPIEIVVGQRGQSCKNVEQHVEIIQDNQKFIRLLQLLGEYSDYYYEDETTNTKMPIGIIIFVDQQTEADELYKELYNKGYQPLLIHGGQDQEDRNFAIYDFKTGVRNILISTSVCARGLDVKHCGLVINFKCPNHLEDYVHRVGRTGRAGKKGVAYTFISNEEAHLAEDILRVLEISGQEIPEDLEQLVRFHREQVETGEAEKRRISGYVGKGFEFSSRERDKIKLNRKELSKNYLMLESDEEEVEIKGEDIEAQREKNKTALALITPGQVSERTQDKKAAMLKDKRAQQIALDVGANAVKNAIISGKTEDEALQIAQEAIERVLNEYRPSVSAEKGSEQAAKIIEEWVERENIKNNIFTCELDINEYPTPARSKVMKKDYLTSISELSKCTVTLRGIFVEPGKKPPLGQKRLHLYIQGSSKQEVLHAFKEIKHFLDEEALNYYTTGNTHGYGGSLGKYHL